LCRWFDSAPGHQINAVVSQGGYGVFFLLCGGNRVTQSTTKMRQFRADRSKEKIHLKQRSLCGVDFAFGLFGSPPQFVYPSQGVLMPNYIYRFSNLAIMLFLIATITVAMGFIPKLLQMLSFFEPSEESTRLGQSLFSPIASSTGLLIGFLLNQAQSNFREVESIVSIEAGRINNLDRLLLRFGSQQALEVRGQLRAYIESVIDDEWHDLSHGSGSKETHLLWRAISQSIFKLDPETPKQFTLYSDIIKKSEEVAESRETRIDRADKRLPFLFWVVIFICLSTLILVNTLFVPSSNFFFGLTILPIAFGGLLSLLVITDQPFKGQTSIVPTALKKVLAAIKTRTE
jgi:Protein of unknown function (DUF4239)